MTVVFTVIGTISSFFMCVDSQSELTDIEMSRPFSFIICQ